MHHCNTRNILNCHFNDDPSPNRQRENCQFSVSYVFLILVKDIIGYIYLYGRVTYYFNMWIKNIGINVHS